MSHLSGRTTIVVGASRGLDLGGAEQERDGESTRILSHPRRPRRGGS
jgi:hypothetical protein